MTDRTKRSMRRALVAATLATVALSSCISTRRPLVLDSTPPGAVVFVDGQSSGHSTPCTIKLDRSNQTLEFRLKGYQPEVRDLRVKDRKTVIFWDEGASTPGHWTFPTFLSVVDFLFPIKREGGPMPPRIHIRLSREAEPVAAADPVGPAIGMAR